MKPVYILELNVSVMMATSRRGPVYGSIAGNMINDSEVIYSHSIMWKVQNVVSMSQLNPNTREIEGYTSSKITKQTQNMKGTLENVSNEKSGAHSFLIKNL